MKLTINLLRPFSDIVGNKQLRLDFEGGTLEDLFTDLAQKYPKLREELYTEKGEVTDYISVFVNDKPISALDGINTHLKDGDELLLFMPISGG